MPDYLIPWSKPGLEGSLLHREGDHGWGQEVDWRKPEVFKAVLSDIDSRRGRSAAYFVWKDKLRPKVEYPMFFSELATMIRSGVWITNGYIYGTFIPVKRGRNYGLKWVDVA